MSTESNRNQRKELIGIVRSKTGDKSVKVVYEYKIPHPLYKKEIRRKTTVHVHDEKNESSVGDKVKILSGVFDGVTTGTPISLIIYNKDTRSKDYEEIKNKSKFFGLSFSNE